MGDLTHLDAEGHARMVDVGAKGETRREAVARGVVLMRPETLEQIVAGELPKGDVFAVARNTGNIDAQHTADITTLCDDLHPTPMPLQLRPAQPGADTAH